MAVVEKKKSGAGGKRKGAGRPKGARTKLTQTAIEAIEQAGINPFKELTKVYKKSYAAGDYVNAGRILSELAKYCQPQLRAVEVNLGDKTQSVLIEMLKGGRERARIANTEARIELAEVVDIDAEAVECDDDNIQRPS